MKTAAGRTPPFPWPTRYVQWRTPGDTEWHDYVPHQTPLTDKKIEIRLLPRPERNPQ